MFRQVDFNREGVYRDRNGSQLVTAGGRMPLNFHQLGAANRIGITVGSQLVTARVPILLNSYQLGAANRVLNGILTKQLDYTPSYYGGTTIGGITLHKVKTQPYKDINIAYKLNKKLIEEFQKRYPNLRPKHQCSWSPTHHVSTDHGVLSMIKLPEAKREIFMIDAHDDANFMWEKQGRVFTTSESGNLMWKDQAIIFTTSKSGNPHGTWLGSYLIQPGNYEHQTQIYYMNTRDLSDTEKETLATLIKMNIVTMGSGCVDIGISECTDINQFIDAQKNSGNVRVICGKDNKPWRICSENSVGEWRSDSGKTIIHVDNCLDGHTNDVAQDNATTSVSEDERKKMQRHFHNYTEMVNQLSKKELFFQDIRFNFHTTEFWLKNNNQEEELQVLFNIIMLSNYLIEAKQDLVLYQQKNNKKDYYIRQKEVEIIQGEIKIACTKSSHEYGNCNNFFRALNQLAQNSNNKFKQTSISSDSIKLE